MYARSKCPPLWSWRTSLAGLKLGGNKTVPPVSNIFCVWICRLDLTTFNKIRWILFGYLAFLSVCSGLPPDLPNSTIWNEELHVRMSLGGKRLWMGMAFQYRLWYSIWENCQEEQVLILVQPGCNFTAVPNLHPCAIAWIYTTKVLNQAQAMHQNANVLASCKRVQSKWLSAMRQSQTKMLLIPESTSRHLLG